jgi:anti-sigma B factor antagonist
VKETTAADEFKIEKEILPDKGVVLMHLAGFLDAHTFERLEEAISGLFAKGHYKLVVDLAGVEYISSAGAGVFIGTLSEAHEHNGNIVLMNPTPNVREVFDLLGLTQIFQIVDDCPAALAAF